ncbi:MAG: cytochrome c [Archangiaceae bacterium]|nr:cytochrome c [Archangiaceae bacterium]
MRHLGLVLTLALAAACFDERDRRRAWNAPEDIDFGHAPAVKVEAAAAPQVAEAPAAAPTVVVVPKFTISSDAAAIAQGKDLFSSKGCVGCHKIGGGKLVGPDLKGVTARRDQEWVSKMILRPDVMVKEDETAKKLLAEHMVPMPNQNVDAAKELPMLLAFLKSNEQ